MSSCKPFRRVRGRHPDVDDHQLRLVLAHKREKVIGVARLADDLEVRALEQAREPFAQEDVVVGNDDASTIGDGILNDP